MDFFLCNLSTYTDSEVEYDLCWFLGFSLSVSVSKMISFGLNAFLCLCLLNDDTLGLSSLSISVCEGKQIA